MMGKKERKEGDPVERLAWKKGDIRIEDEGDGEWIIAPEGGEHDR